jgi:hypothetical protein
VSERAPELVGGIIGRLRTSSFRDSIFSCGVMYCTGRRPPVVLVECFDANWRRHGVARQPLDGYIRRQQKDRLPRL